MVNLLPRIFDEGIEEKVELHSFNCTTAFIYCLARHHPKHKESIQHLADKLQKWKIDAVSGTAFL